MTYEFDLDWLAEHYPVIVNDEKYSGRIAVGDVLDVNGVTYTVQGINEDAVVVKQL